MAEQLACHSSASEARSAEAAFHAGAPFGSLLSPPSASVVSDGPPMPALLERDDDTAGQSVEK